MNMELSRASELIQKAYEIWQKEKIDVISALIKAERELTKEENNERFNFTNYNIGSGNSRTRYSN